MMHDKNKKEDKHLKSVLMAHLILVLHVMLIAGLVLLVLFFRGILNYTIWVVLGGSAIVIASCYKFYMRMKSEGRTIRKILNAPQNSGRTVEVSFLGGLASLKVGRSYTPPALGDDSPRGVKQLEDPDAIRIKELSDLVQLLENNLITLDEYNKYKENIFKS
jgi:hypothetical protein